MNNIQIISRFKITELGNLYLKFLKKLNVNTTNQMVLSQTLKIKSQKEDSDGFLMNKFYQKFCSFYKSKIVN